MRTLLNGRVLYFTPTESYLLHLPYMNIESIYKKYLENPTIETDSRKAGKGSIFFALKGDKFNGNQFAKQALDSGAAYCIVDEDPGFLDDRIIKVEDSLSTLQQLAKYHREQFNIPFIAVTGSNGKTTTKELIHVVLSSTYITYTTIGNLNNHIGIPLTILRVGKDAQMAIIEMGANHQKEIEGYCEYTLPTHGLITNCGKAHLEGFGGVEGVKKGKGELYDYMRANKGTVFMYADYDYLKDMSKSIQDIITYGSQDGEIRGESTLTHGMLAIKMTKGMSNAIINTQLVGEYNLPNVLAAISIGKYFNVPEEKIVEAIESYTPTNSRSQMIRKGNNEIILDAYNANPSSMRVAIENFSKMPGKNKVVLLGGMMELGAESLAEHAALISLLRQHSWSHVVLVGKDFISPPSEYLHFNDVAEAQQWYRQQQFDNSTILIKGSRSMQMEKVLE